MTLNNRYILLILLVILCFSSAVSLARSMDRLEGEQEKTAVEMSKLYANHLYRRYCMETFHPYVSDKGVVDRVADPKSYALLEKGCGCYTDFIISHYSSSSVIEYLQMMWGYFPPEDPALNKIRQSYVLSKSGNALSSASDNVDLRKKCGFPY